MGRPGARWTVLALVASLGFVAPDALESQLAPGARSVAMGGGGMVYATGVDAVEWNPANLAWAGGWNVALFEVGIATMSSGATFGEILTIAGAEGLPFFSTDLTTEQIIAQMPADGVTLSTVSEGFATAFATEQGGVPSPGSPLPSVGIAVGPVGVRVRSEVLSDFTVSRELADLIGNGFLLEKLQEYRVGGTGWSTTSFSDITVSYGTRLGGIMSLGVGGRYVMGHGLTRGRFFEPVVDFSPSAGEPFLSLESVVVEATGGSGVGLDLGFSLDLPLGVRVAGSGTNVFQRMTWDDGLVAHTATFTDADFSTSVDFIDLRL